MNFNTSFKVLLMDMVRLLYNTMTKMRELEPSQRTISTRHYLVEIPGHIL